MTAGACRDPLLTTHYSLLTTHYSLLTTRHSPLPRIDPLLDLLGRAHDIALLGVEAEHRLVVFAHQQVNLPDAARLEPGLGGRHQLSPVAATPAGRIDAHVIHGAAVAIVPDHGAGDDAALGNAHQHVGGWPAPRKRQIGCGVVPRPRQPTSLPQGDDGHFFPIGNRPYVELAVGHG